MSVLSGQPAFSLNLNISSSRRVHVYVSSSNSVNVAKHLFLLLSGFVAGNIN